jgi:phage tail tape-measure protein
MEQSARCAVKLANVQSRTERTMKKLWIVPALCLALGAATGAQAGCLTGAAAGAVVGHVAGHHALLGAAAGCAIGHHHAAKEKRANDANNQNNTPK